jgi:hypothetical protein
MAQQGAGATGDQTSKGSLDHIMILLCIIVYGN